MEKIKFKKFAVVSFAAVMLLSAAGLSACGSAADGEEEKLPPANETVQPVEEKNDKETTPEVTDLPDSILIYGQVAEITKGEDGSISQILIDSEESGELIINVGPQTFWINSGEMKADDPSTIKEGEKLYVFHSPVVTMSLPGQSAGFAVVRNIPADARCAMYHEIEEVTKTEEGLSILTNNGQVTVSADKETLISAYDGSEASADDIKAGGFMMVSYDADPKFSDENPRAFHIMLLPQVK